MSKIVANKEVFVTARVSRGWTQRDLAKSCRISPSYISLIERGMKSVGPRTAKRISEHLGMKWDEVFVLQNDD